MKKYDYYRPSASSLGRKKKTRRTSAVSFLKPFVFFLVFVSLCFAAYFGASKAYKAFSASRLGHWQAEEAAVSGADGVLAKELQAAADKQLHKDFSVSDAVAFQAQLSKKYPQLRDVSVKRGLLSGKLKVSVKRREPVAKFILPDGAVRFVDQDSTVYADPNPDPLLTVPFVELEGSVPDKLGGEFVDLVQSALKLKKQLDFAFLRFNTDKNTVRLYLPDDTVIDFGQARDLRPKPARAAQIEAVAAEKGLPAPHELDFTYFDDGKVFLRQTGH